MRLQRLYRTVRVIALLLIVLAALLWGLTSYTQWPLLTALKHIAVFPSCSAARVLGLAPAESGEPGYWSHHDADADGTAC